MLKTRHVALLDELHAAALCMGAVQHPDFEDDRKALLRKKGKARLENAAREYHAFVIALSVLGNVSDPTSA